MRIPASCAFLIALSTLGIIFGVQAGCPDGDLYQKLQLTIVPGASFVASQLGAIWGQCKNSAYHLFSRVLTLTQNIRYHEYRGGKILRSVPSFYAKIESVIVGVMSALGAGYKQAEPRHARDGVF